MASKINKNNGDLVAQNKKARYDYFIEETVEAGLVLTGTEVKSLRLGGASIQEAHADFKGNEMYIFNAHIPEYEPAGNHLQHEARRPRKLLLHNRELKRLLGLKNQKGYTLIPTRLYFNARGIAKLQLGLAKGKKQHDKRDTIKKRDWERRKSRIMAEH